MKWVVWTLLTMNLAVAGFFMGRSHWPQASPDQNAPMNVDRLSLRRQADPAPNGAPSPRVAAARAMCVEWRGLNLDEFAQVRVVVFRGRAR